MRFLRNLFRNRVKFITTEKGLTTGHLVCYTMAKNPAYDPKGKEAHQKEMFILMAMIETKIAGKVVHMHAPAQAIQIL